MIYLESSHNNEGNIINALLCNTDDDDDDDDDDNNTTNDRGQYFYRAVPKPYSGFGRLQVF